MLYLVRALVFLLETAVAAAGVTVTLSGESQPPTGATLLGSVPAVVLPVRTLKLTRGTGPALRTFWTGYWTLTP
jgi:hypothetical protein